jgi:hypothetical protein
VGIITFPIVIAYQFDFDIWIIGLLLFASLIIRLSVKLDIAQLRGGFARRRQYDRTWLCLTCGYQWVETKDDVQKA